MQLVEPGGKRLGVLVGRDGFEQLRDLGVRLEHIVWRYGRLVANVGAGTPVPEIRDSVESLNSQLGYVAQRLQEELVTRFEQRLRSGDVEEEDVRALRGEVAVRAR